MDAAGARLETVVDEWAKKLEPAMRDYLNREKGPGGHVMLFHRFLLEGAPGLNRDERRALRRTLESRIS